MLASFSITIFFLVWSGTPKKSPAPFKKRDRDKDAIRQGDTWARHFKEKKYTLSLAHIR